MCQIAGRDLHKRRHDRPQTAVAIGEDVAEAAVAAARPGCGLLIRDSVAAGLRLIIEEFTGFFFVTMAIVSLGFAIVVGVAALST